MSQKTMQYLRKAIPAFTMLQDESRQDMLILLFDKGEMTVNQLTDHMSLSRPTVSHHLKLLYSADLVTYRKDGKERYYSVCLEEALVILKDLVQSIEEDLK